MKLLIKTLCLITLLATGFQSNAQVISIKGGLNYSSVNYYRNEENRSDEFGYKMGYQLGANAALPVSDKYSINIAAIFMKRNHDRLDIPEPQDEWHIETSRWYLELPVLLRREFALNKFGIFGEIGPYVGIGIGSSVTSEYKFYKNGEFVQEGKFIYDWGNEDSDIKRFDFGINIGFGILMKKLEIGMSYAHGFINSENEEWNESKNRVFMINCAYPLFSFKE